MSVPTQKSQSVQNKTERKGTRVFVLTEMKAASLAKEETRWGLVAL